MPPALGFFTTDDVLEPISSSSSGALVQAKLDALSARQRTRPASEVSVRDMGLLRDG
jgi:hypothetical protein